MWTSPRLSRTSSVNSLARSVVSSRGSSFGDSDTAGDEEFPIPPSIPPSNPMWQRLDRMPQKAQSVAVHVMEMPRRQSFSSGAGSEHPTLAEEMDLPEKTPTLPPVRKSSPPEHGFAPGPLEMQLSALLSKIINIEREAPTIMAEDYKRLEDKIRSLETEKTALMTRYEALYAIRDQDVANLVKVRQLLADERREHQTMREVRDRDLVNVLELREKLAQFTWTRPQSMTRPPSIERRNTSADMWQMAKSAAMEHRALELEKANEELLAQLATMKKENENLKTSPKGTSTSTVDVDRLEAIHEDHARYREKMAQRMQQLRSEKESLQRELSSREDECADFQAKVDRLQRGLSSDYVWRHTDEDDI